MLTGFFETWFGQSVRPRVIVVGNSKGGSGKSTTAIHITSGLQSYGYSVGCIDLDGRQATLSNFLDNRRRFSGVKKVKLDLPVLHTLAASQAESLEFAEASDCRAFARAFHDLVDRDYIVVDTPGSDCLLSRLAHTMADILVSPMNDSFLDLDVLVRIDHDGKRILGPSAYAIAVLDRWGAKGLVSGSPIEWVVMRNRLAQITSRNQVRLGELLEDLGPRLGFRAIKGFGERVIYRELFPLGLTVLDPLESLQPRAWTVSNSRARVEVWALLRELGLPMPKISRLSAAQEAVQATHGQESRA